MQIIAFHILKDVKHVLCRTEQLIKFIAQIAHTPPYVNLSIYSTGLPGYAFMNSVFYYNFSIWAANI